MLVVDVLEDVEDVEDVEDIVVVVAELTLEMELYADVSSYRESPFAPPHISAVLPAQVMEHLPSVAIAELATRVLSQ